MEAWSRGINPNHLAGAFQPNEPRDRMSSGKSTAAHHLFPRPLLYSRYSRALSSLEKNRGDERLGRTHLRLPQHFLGHVLLFDQVRHASPVDLPPLPVVDRAMVARLVDAHVEFESVENESRTRWPLAELELVSVSSPTTASAGTKPQAANYAVNNAAMYGGAPQRVIAGTQKTDEAVPVTFKRTNHAEEKCASAHMWCFTQCGPADGTREMPRQVHPAR